MNSSEWKNFKLVELGKLARGKSKHRPRDAAFLYGGPYPFIQTGDIKSSNHKIYKYNQTYSEAGLAQSKLWQEGTIAITIAANIAETGILTFPACFPDSVLGFVADPQKCDIEFIEYLLQFYKKQIQSHAVGSVQDNINLGTFENVEFNIPPLGAQRHIANILSVLDDKIELNHQINFTLESIAQAIFTEWFIEFNIPGESIEKVESELGIIPQGWKAGKLEDVCELTKGVSYKSDELQPSNTALVTLKSINRGGGFNFDGFKEYIGRYKPSQLLSEGDLVFAQTDITQNAEVVGSPAIVEDPFGYEYLVASLDIVKCKPINEMPSSEVLYYFLKHQQFKEYCLSHTNGSTVLHLRTTEVPNYPFVIPSKKILRKFDQIVSPIRKEIISNNRQSQLLGSLRDSLLPRLMSGEIEV